MNKNIRTDLALEAHQLSKQDGNELDGVIVTEEKNKEIKISRIEITNQNGEKALGKAMGNYITIECPNLRYSTDDYETVCKEIAHQIQEMTEINSDSLTLVVGLGNEDITPDALGIKALSHLMITNHLKKHMKEYLGDNISGVCAMSAGVLGTTGMESADTVKSIVDTLKPDLVIVIDALAAADINRVSTTIQISDAGILPGAGVGNNRQGINKETLGTKVIAIGVPTVIDARNISDIEIPQELSPLMVTVKDIDLVIKKCAKTIADGINLALHKDITLEEISAFMG